jgi:3',5'-cyclic AMP phosphodiesterase CpdA
MFTLAHLSDPHLAPLPQPTWSELIGKRATGYLNWRRKRRFIHVRAVLDTITADIAGKADHIAFTGDIANIALPEEFTRGRVWLQGLGTPKDVSLVPGNHDIYVRGAAHDAERCWGEFMQGDNANSVHSDASGNERSAFPFIRRRGPLAMIGACSGVPTAWGMATGKLGARQLAALGLALDEQRDAGLFRVLLIHHPPVSQAGWQKRLVDAAALLRVIAEHGAELVLHGHDHRRMINWLEGPNGSRVPAVGVPSASAAPGMAKDAAAYNLYRIDGTPGAWRCEMVSRGIGASGAVEEQTRSTLLGAL